MVKQFARATIAEWMASSFVPYPGELVVGYSTLGTYEIKIGDGVSPWSTLKSQVVLAGLPGAKFKPGYYYAPQAFRGTTQPSDGSLSLTAFLVPTQQAFDRIGIEVTTLAAGVVTRLGIYNDSGQGVPDALVLDAGTVSAATATPVEAAISITLSPGLYWLAAASQGGTPTYRSINSYITTQLAGTTLAAATSSASVVGFTKSGVSGALPANIGTPTSTTGGATLVVLRAA